MKSNQPGGNREGNGDPKSSCVDVKIESEYLKEQILYLFTPGSQTGSQSSAFGFLGALRLKDQENAGDTDLQNNASCGYEKPTAWKCKDDFVSTDPAATRVKPFCEGPYAVAAMENDMLGASCNTGLASHTVRYTEDNTSCSDRPISYCQCPESCTSLGGNPTPETTLSFCAGSWKKQDFHTNSTWQDDGDCADIHENISFNATCKCPSVDEPQSACLPTGVSDPICTDVRCLDTSTSAVRPEDGDVCRCNEPFCINPDNTSYLEDGQKGNKADEMCTTGSCVDVHILLDSTKGRICQCTSDYRDLPGTACVALAEDTVGGPSKEDQTAKVSHSDNTTRCDDVDIYCRCKEGFEEHDRTSDVGVVALHNGICNSLQPMQQKALAGNIRSQPTLLHFSTAMMIARMAMDINT